MAKKVIDKEEIPTNVELNDSIEEIVNEEPIIEEPIIEETVIEDEIVESSDKVEESVPSEIEIQDLEVLKKIEETVEEELFIKSVTLESEITGSKFDEIIGLTIEEADQFIQLEGHQMRIVKSDIEVFEIDNSYNPGRINVEVSGNKILSIISIG